MATLSNCLGWRVKLTTSLGEEIEGDILSHDNATQTVVVQESFNNLKRNIRLLKTGFVSNVEVVGKSVTPVATTLPHVDVEAVHKREEQRLRQAEGDLHKIGVGVTQQAQDIFDALCKTMSCEWDDQTIVVFGTVKIEPPYTAECAKGGQSSELGRVKKVLEGERRRLNL